MRRALQNLMRFGEVSFHLKSGHAPTIGRTLDGCWRCDTVVTCISSPVTTTTTTNTRVLLPILTGIRICSLVRNVEIAVASRARRLDRPQERKTLSPQPFRQGHMPTHPFETKERCSRMENQ